MSGAEIIGWVMFFVTVIVFISIVGWWFSKKGEIIEREEKVKASDADLSSTKEKAREVIKNAFIMAELATQSEKKMLNELNKDGKNGQLYQLLQFKSIEAQTQAQRIMFMEMDDVLYKQEIVNSRRQEYNAKIKQPLTSLVAASMGKEEKPYLDEMDKSIFADALEGAGRELLALSGKLKEDRKNLMFYEKDEKQIDKEKRTDENA